MTKKNLLIIGAGGVAHVAAHKAAMQNDVLGDICIASRTLSKCEAIIDSVQRKGHLQGPSGKLHARQLDALDVAATAALIRETESEIVVNLGSAFVNMSVLDACLETGAAYIDTAIHEDPDMVCEDPPWYANYEWKKAERAPTRASRRSSAPGSIPASSTPTPRWPPSSTSTRSTRSTSSTSTPARTAGTSPPTSTRRSTSASSSRCGRGSTASGRSSPPTR